MLVVLSGLPGAGKTTLARELAREVGGVHVRIDVLEQGLADLGLSQHGPVGAGYGLGHAVAGDALRSARHVVVDAVNAVPKARAGWRDLAAAVGVPLLAVEVVCSDTGEHERRVRERTADIPGHGYPTWAEVAALGWAPHEDDRVVVDTAVHPLHALVADLAARVRARPEQATTPARLLAGTHRLGAGEVVLTTERLVLRRWRTSDLGPFAALNADPEVMAHFAGGPLDAAASEALARYADACFDVHGYGLAAVEERGRGFVGFVGLAHHRRRPDEVEVGWRLARAAWGRGLATEAARAWVRAAWAVHQLPWLACFVAAGNARSLAVARRLGMPVVSREVWDGQEVVVHALDLPAALV